MVATLVLIYNAVVMVCCCFRFRIPRTKQQIEADYQRRKITCKFRRQLETIQDAKMDAMSLKDGNLRDILYTLLHSFIIQNKGKINKTPCIRGCSHSLSKTRYNLYSYCAHSFPKHRNRNPVYNCTLSLSKHGNQHPVYATALLHYLKH